MVNRIPNKNKKDVVNKPIKLLNVNKHSRIKPSSQKDVPLKQVPKSRVEGEQNLRLNVIPNYSNDDYKKSTVINSVTPDARYSNEDVDLASPGLCSALRFANEIKAAKANVVPHFKLSDFQNEIKPKVDHDTFSIHCKCCRRRVKMLIFIMIKRLCPGRNKNLRAQVLKSPRSTRVHPNCVVCNKPLCCTQVVKKTNVPFTEQIFHSLVDLQINDDAFVSGKKTFTKSHEFIQNKDKIFHLEDYYKPNFSSEFCPKVPFQKREIEKIQYYNGFEIYDRINSLPKCL